ncbi:zincin-like metallopeptidase domain-containing protein [Methylobacter psychrophilus]
MANNNKPFHEIVAEKLIKQLEEGTAPWQRPWDSGESGAFLPYNPVTDNRYKGINSLYLLAQARDDQRWMTYKQAIEAGAQVRKGEKGTGIQYWKFVDEHLKKDAAGKPLVDSNGKPVKDVVKLERPQVFFATVFNAEQIDGLPPIQRQEQTWNPIERAEGILAACGVAIHYNGSGRAFYRPLTDSIHLPDKGQFPSAENFYATALHELGHSTGHPDRLNRDLSHPFGSEGYAREELRAEIASMILGDTLGIGHDPSQHAAYVGSWIKALKDDPLEIFRAAADAEKIQNYVLGIAQSQVQEHATQQDPEAVEAHRQQPTQVDSLQASEVTTMTAATINPEQLATSVVEGIERVKSGLAKWNHSVVQGIGEGAAAVVIDLVQQGKYDEALAHLQTVGAIEATHSDQGHFAEIANTLEQGWRAWQQENGLGSAITPAMQRAFASIPTELSQLASATAADYQKAAALARLEEQRVKSDPKSTAEAISAAREQRKTADLAATVHDSDFRKKVIEIEQQQSKTNAVQATNSPNQQGHNQDDKVYINVPFREKNAAKSLGARWDRGQQSWYIPAGVEQALFATWQPSADVTLNAQAQTTIINTTTDEVRAARQYLAVPYRERMAAKAEGALWDKQAKSWYALPTADRDKLHRWLPENVKNQQAPAMTPREEFAEALQTAGCVVTGQHPVMDGNKHRIKTVGDKTGERAGFYVGHLDSHPAGYIQNNRTGEVLKWKAKGYSLSAEEKATWQADSAAKLQQREAAQKSQQNAVAEALRELLAIAPPAPADHQYLQTKQVRPGDLRIVPMHGGALPADSAVIIGKTLQESTALRATNPDKLVFTAGDLLLTAQDVNGDIRSVQAIQKNGRKRFAAGGAKQDTFHVVGGQGLDALEKAPAIVIGEGYATADTLSQALGYATVAAFDSGNLPNVAKQLREKFPDKPLVIAGDNDVHLALTEGKNPGKEKALAAAKAVEGTAIFPIFFPNEQSYPANLEPVTSSKARTGNLTDEQQEAIAKMKRYTDFNDLVTNSVLGREGLERQVTTRLNSIIEGQRKQLMTQQKPEQKQAQSEKFKQQHQRKAIKM